MLYTITVTTKRADGTYDSRSELGSVRLEAVDLFEGAVAAAHLVLGGRIEGSDFYDIRDRIAGMDHGGVAAFPSGATVTVTRNYDY